MKIAVLGAGPGAFALAACLVLKNYQVSLYEQAEFAHNIQELAVGKSLTIDGYVKGEARLNCVTLDLAEAVAGAEYIFIVTHAAAHAALAAGLAPLLKEGQCVVLFPGYVAGALAFKAALQQGKAAIIPCVAESSVLPFACRRTGPAAVFVGGWKKDFILASSRADLEIPPIWDLFGKIPVSNNLLETGLNETNFIIHTCVSLLNIGLVESGADWTFYRQGLSPSVGTIIELVDKERLALLQKLGLAQISLGQWLLKFYGSQGAAGATAYEVLKNFPYFASSPGPKSFNHRYFTEDIPYGLAPMTQLGQKYQVHMPVANMLVDLANTLTGNDFRLAGRKNFFY